MPRPVSRKSSLVRLLDEWNSPFCLLDAERQVVYCNQQLATQLGSTVEEIVGQTCAYHSEPGSSRAIADPSGDQSAADSASASDRPASVNGICPPRDFFDENHSRGHVRLRKTSQDTDRETVPFPASFHRMMNRGGELIGMLVVAEPQPATMPSSLADAHLLHDQVAAQRQQLRSHFDSENLIGTSAIMRRVRRQIEIANDSEGFAVVVGPKGTGKEHVARTIHVANDPQNKSLLVPLSSSMVDAESLRSTVTALLSRSAEQEDRRPAILLLLDVDQLSELVQEELLRTLASKDSRLRVLSTSTCDLRSLSARGTFSAELAERLSTIVIELTPLFERPEDIPLLCQYFLEKFNAGSQGASLRESDREQFVGFSESANELLVAYAWPGNIDELKDIVRQSIEVSEPPYIEKDQLPHRLLAGIDAALNPVDQPVTVDLESHLAAIERELIREALERNGGNKTQTAKALHVSRPKLLRRIEQLGINDKANG